MKNKKGFTLVELLAIIVILAVIMVIAVPKILDVVNGSKDSAWKNNVNMIARSIKTNTQTIDPVTGNYKYTISNLCTDTSKLKEIAKIEDTNITCSEGTFTLTGTGQFEGKSATISCTDGKCGIEIDELVDGVIRRGKLTRLILAHNDAITTPAPANTVTYNDTNSGLFAENITGGFGGADGTTYYYRGKILNNYVSYAGMIWRIVRINEDGTTRLVLNTPSTIIDGGTKWGDWDDYMQMYYSNSLVKPIVENWFIENIGNNSQYLSKVATGGYFCEEARVVSDGRNNVGSGSSFMKLLSRYTPDLTCNEDPNGKGLITSGIGLLTFDEIYKAGAKVDSYAASNDVYYLSTSDRYWTMSPGGYDNRPNYVWSYGRSLSERDVRDDSLIRPVIILKKDIIATGIGTESDPYVIE